MLVIILKKALVCLLLEITFLFTSCLKEDNGSLSEKSGDVAATTKSNYKTYTGFEPLEVVDLLTPDPQNTAGLPEIKIEHAYGVAKNEIPHSISVESQKFFEEKNYQAVTYDTKSKKKVLYLTFDCGYENGNTVKILDVLKAKNVTAAFFCTLDDIKSEPELIARMIKEGHIVGNHSSTHPSFTEISREKMTVELEECENFLRTEFGYSAEYFRFPKGEYSESALDLVGALGFKSVFWSVSYSDWDTKNQKGSDYAFEKVTSRLHPGAIILLHSVSSDNADALSRIIDYANEKGYVFASLENLF